jgi:predicted  nucleic acid-binding Zn-ribbon protein
MDNDTSKQEILSAINNFAGSVDQRFEKIDQRFDKVDQQFDKVDQRFDKVDQRFDKIEATMVTKDYLDDKLADLRGDLTILMRKEDKKVTALIALLADRKIITEDDKKQLMTMEPFPTLFP